MPPYRLLLSPILLLALLLPVAGAEAQPRARASASVDVTEATLPGLQAAMAAGRTSAVQLVDAYLARIAAYDQAGPALNSLIRLNPKARAEAAVLDRERRAGKLRGPLHGIPVIVKDNYDTRDMPTTGGSLALATSQPAADAFVVTKLRKAGAIILAKSNLHELAAGITSISSLGGQTRNPYDPARCPGGSSGGTGAAIAASFATVGWGSDTCGSIRIPSAYNNLVGLRPTMGLISRTGIIPLSHTQDIGGPLARTVTDLAIALDISIGPDSADPVTRVMQQHPSIAFQAALRKDALKGARIGVFLPYFRETDSEIADTVRAAIAEMQRQGASVVQVTMPEFDTLMTNTSVINMETKFDLIDYLRGVPNAPIRSLKEILESGRYDRQLEVRFRTIDTMPAADTPLHRVALTRQQSLAARMTFLLDSLQLTAIAYPTMRQKPVALGEAQPGGTCNLSAQSGLPAISLPAGFTSDGLPVGLELLGAAFSDTKLVAMAYALEHARPVRATPHTTPRLVSGVAPAARPTTIVIRGKGISATTTITVDYVRNELRWNAAITGPKAATIDALVLMRTGGGTPLSGPISGSATTGTVNVQIAVPSNATRVDARLLGPGMRSGSGTMPLTAVQRRAIAEERLHVGLWTTTGLTSETVVPR